MERTEAEMQTATQHQCDSDSAAPEVTVLRVSYQFMINYNYVVVDPVSRQAVVVDPAWQTDVIEQAIADAQATLSGVLITHSHPDHIHLAKPLAANYDCPIWMSREEIAASGFEARQLIGIDATPWQVGQMWIQPIHTPGHTQGCMCYLIGDNLFTGDVLFAEGCGLCPDVEAAHAMFSSLEQLKRRLKPQTRIFPGHSYGREPGQFFSRVLQENIYLHFQDAASFAAFRLRKVRHPQNLFDFK